MPEAPGGFGKGVVAIGDRLSRRCLQEDWSRRVRSCVSGDAAAGCSGYVAVWGAWRLHWATDEPESQAG